MLTLNKSAR